MTNITTSFVEGSARFSWSVPEASLGEMSTEVLVTRDGDRGNWTPVRNQSYTVRDCLTFSTIEIDVRFLSSQKEIALCRGLFTKLNKPDAFIKQKGKDATLNWTIPFFPSSILYSIFKHSGSDKWEREIIRVEDNKVTPINMEKYNYTSKPLNSTLIVFNVHNLTHSDAGVYAGGISSFDAARKRGVLLVVADKPAIPTIAHTSVPRYGEVVTLTCNSSSTTYPKASAHMVLYLVQKWLSSSRKGNIHVHASPAEPKIIRISSNTSPGVLLVTWEPNYNSGSSQYFLVYLLNLTIWNLVANTTDSDATIEYSEASGPEEAVAVMAYNTHGCSRPAKLIRGFSE
uniref:Uncharacterized protein LOC111129612 n=1 Tax=Crassostrea virginica TaxID=6565 RepID=A0A8B8DXQ9_CRAVI|nr:uncharacterized protein LOC111129612 [Crassostrea virginica]